MNRGDVIADRFEIEHPSGSGGMGQVYRARDRRSGELVAVKVLHQVGRVEMERFTREAEVLATLEHPGVVRYIEGGATARGEPYLVMEWLEGETLSERLRRRQLTTAESLSLGVRAAMALASIHRRGVVHRDLKPSNLFLRGGAVDHVVLIDFGIAWRTDAGRHLTVPGALIGTPGYIAPEQARGVPDIDARADVFSLGCVLFRCLAGRAPFQGDDALAVLLKVAAADPPRVSELRPGIPADLDDLVARMLSKAREARPADGAAAAAELLALEDSAPFSSGVISVPPPAPAELTAVERRVMSLILARRPPGTDEPTLPAAEAGVRERAIRAATERHRGQLSILADGSLLVLLASADAATDLAGRAARCALAMRGLLGGGAVVVVSGRGIPGPRLPTGELIDRAVELLSGTPDGAPIRVDEVTASLVSAGFDAESAEGGWILRGERSEPDYSRPLLGKPTACVGRERELVQIEAAFDQCVEERMAVAVLITAAVGLGKSRLCHELVKKLRAREPTAEIWIGRGDPMSAGSAFALLGQALRRAAGIVDGEPLAARRDKLRARVARRAGAEADPLCELLGDLVGTHFSDDATTEDGALAEAAGDGRGSVPPPARAGRDDLVLRGERMRRAFLSFLRAECAAQPVVIVLEDLHWGDLPTVRFLDAALAELREQPLMVLATGRPEVHALFPRLWATRGVQEIRLRELSRRASERLVRQVLGQAVGEDTLDAIVTRADGNAFYLEELIRAAADGKGAAPPETVLAMVQARLERLHPDARRVLRAASVFGEAFWKEGVEALLGSTGSAPWLGELAAQELIAPAPHGRFPSSAEYRFRHALVRDAAYGMLAEADRALGHELAGAWLEAAGETDPMVLAEHYERGGAAPRAVAWFARAAAQALEGGDLDGVVARAERALAGGASGLLRGKLHAMQGYVHVWRTENAAAAASYHAALSELEQGNGHYYLAMGGALYASVHVGDFDRLSQLVATLRERLHTDDGPLHVAQGMTAAVPILCVAGEHDLAARFIQRLTPPDPGSNDTSAGAVSIDVARCHFAYYAEGDAWALRSHAAAALEHGERAEEARVVHMVRAYQGVALVELGQAAEGEALLRGTWETASALGLHLVAQFTELFLLTSLLARRAIDEAEAVLDACGKGARESVLMDMLRTLMSARVARLRGRLDDAAAGVNEVLGLSTRFSPGYTAEALVTLALVERDRGDAAASVAAARRAAERIDAIGTWCTDTAIRLHCADVLHTAGEDDLARRVLAAALARVEARAARIGDPVYRASFLERVAANAQTIALAQRLSIGAGEAP